MKILIILALVVFTLVGTFAEYYAIFGSEHEREKRICAAVMGGIIFFLADVLSLIKLIEMLCTE